MKNVVFMLMKKSMCVYYGNICLWNVVVLWSTMSTTNNNNKQ